MTHDTEELCGTLDESRGYNMNTCSGLPIWPADPRPEDIRVFDVIGSLSRICRFNGHLKASVQSYTVGQHSCLVHDEVVRELQRDGIRDRKLELAALLHDASEYIYGDMVKPQKRLFAERKMYEQAGDVAIAKKFEFDVGLFDHPLIKKHDYKAFLTEKRDLCYVERTDFGAATDTPYPEEIVPWKQPRTFNEFLSRLQWLYK